MDPMHMWKKNAFVCQLVAERRGSLAALRSRREALWGWEREDVRGGSSFASVTDALNNQLLRTLLAN